jgi:hypothetical protein
MNRRDRGSSYLHIISQRCGSGTGIRCFFDPKIRDGEKSGSGMNIPDNFPRAEKQFLGLKMLIFFDACPGSGIF